MSGIGTIARAILGLFVDDGGFAATILVWIAAVGVMASRLGLASDRSAVALFVGLAIILLASATRRARR